MEDVPARLRARFAESERLAAAALVRGEQWVRTSDFAASSPGLLLDDLPILRDLLDEHGTNGPLCLQCLRGCAVRHRPGAPSPVPRRTQLISR